MLVSKAFTFEASHILPKHPGKCSRLHGHSWKLEIMIDGPVNKDSSFVCDFYDLKKLIDTHIIEKLDHTHLGEGVALTNYLPSTSNDSEQGNIWEPYFGHKFYPSSENLVVAIAKVLVPLMPELAPGVSLAQVKLQETCTSSAYWINTDLFQNLLEIR